MITEEYFSDKKKVEFWVDVCQERGWLEPRKVNLWIKENEIAFTKAGSALPTQVYMSFNEEYIKSFIKQAKIQNLCLMILNVLVGLMTFSDLETEIIFWQKIHDRLENSFDFKIPEKIIPKYVKES